MCPKFGLCTSAECPSGSEKTQVGMGIPATVMARSGMGVGVGVGVGVFLFFLSFSFFLFGCVFWERTIDSRR